MKKMVMAVVPRDQANMVLEALITSGYPVTSTESRGGVLRQAQYTLYTCVEEETLENVLSIIREHCRAQVEMETENSADQPLLEGMIPFTTHLGGAVVFVWDVLRIETY